jgi:small nuclear ribonucleoprotein (snRNP)-like protein
MQRRTNLWYVGSSVSDHKLANPVPPQLVELKNGETFNGHLVNCDNFMNITLREVYQTNADGDRFWKLKECYIRGSTVRHTLAILPIDTLIVLADKILACS